MRFQRVRLENFKCYANAKLRLGPGVTVIHGLNGSGKSSLLEACFFALYGSRALDGTLDEAVTIGADDAEVELWFSHGGEEYHVERRVRATGDGAQTARCVLETPDTTVEGARDVRAYVADLLRMDHEAFVNCAYVRQGEVNKLINASPAERQDMLDSLLQLGKLEEYRERASMARRGVGRVRDDKQGALSQVEKQIEQKEDSDLHARLNSLEADLSEVEAEIERYEENRANARETRDEAVRVLEEYDEKREQLEDLASKIEDLRSTISETERDRDELRERIERLTEQIEEMEAERADLLAETDLDGADPDAIRDRIGTLRERREEIETELTEAVERRQSHASRAESLADAAEDLEARAADTREEADELAESVAEREAELARRREELDELEADIESLEAEFRDAPLDRGEADSHLSELESERERLREEITDLRASVETRREAVEDAERLLAEGKCPECGQDVEGSPHVTSLEDDREELAALEADLEAKVAERDRLEERIERAETLVEIEGDIEQKRERHANLAPLLDQRRDAIEEDRERVERLREKASSLESDAAEKREAAAEKREAAETVREQIAEYNREKSALRESIERLEDLEAVVEEIADAESTVEDLREKRANKAELNDERRERLADLRERRNDLQAEFDEEKVERAREEKERAETYLREVEEELESLRERESEIRDRIGGVRQELATLESLREERDDLAETVERLDSLYDEVERLQEMYGSLRAQLRRRNVESLEAMLNEIFDLVYQNDSYARIELSGEYELTVYQKDGEPLDPAQLSGGERALFNLSLRCAIYRLLAEGIEGSAPMPPLILDEPTVFLDSGHVSQLVELVAAMGQYGVEQILVVSHDEELVAAADDLIRVRKDATTNRSTVERTDAVEGLAGVDADAEAD